MPGRRDAEVGVDLSSEPDAGREAGAGAVTTSTGGGGIASGPAQEAGGLGPDVAGDAATGPRGSTRGNGTDSDFGERGRLEAASEAGHVTEIRGGVIADDTDDATGEAERRG